ncbi:CIC11C00000004149 [Sungouiella intermedia]|uniref:CIC11C00000004149 n=1 Tax=Sungouiella intermedia TaxID=45354 RepID=A0A1L0D0I9_9ASCO|nr:CIC11C00000004149 [[Candida] intermedia]
MLCAIVLVLHLLALVAAKYLEISSDLGTYYLQASDGRYILTDDISKAYGNFTVDFRIHGVEELGVARDNRVLDGAFYSLDVTKATGFFRGEYLILSNEHFSWYVCPDPVTASGDWLLYIKDDRFNYTDFISSTEDGASETGSSDISSFTDISSHTDISSTTEETSTVESSIDNGGLGEESSTTDESTDIVVGGDTSTDRLVEPTDVTSPDGALLFTDPLETIETPAIDTPQQELGDTSTANAEPLPVDDTTTVVDTPLVDSSTPTAADGEADNSPAEIVLAIESALRFLRNKRAEPDVYYAVNYDQCYPISVLLVDEPVCVSDDCSSSSCATLCVMASCTGSPCFPEICTTLCPGDSCPTVCSKTLCADSASCPAPSCTTECPKGCLTVCPTQSCSSGALLCPPASCTTQCPGECDVICNASCSGSACSCVTSCDSGCSGTSCPCTGPLCPGGGNEGGGDCTTCGGEPKTRCSGLRCQGCTTCDKTVTFPGCPTCVHTFTDFVITCPSATTITISTCPNVNQCSPKVLSLSPGTHTLSGTAVVAVKSNIVLTIKAAGATGTAGSGSGTSGSGGSGSSTRSSTTGNSGGSTKDLVGTFFGALAFVILMW